MSHSKVYLNGNYVGEWPYGYASFGFDVTDFVDFGNKNMLAVRLENKPLSSRWYPGAGLYRDVRMVITNPVHVNSGVLISPHLTFKTEREQSRSRQPYTNKSGQNKLVELITDIYSSDNNLVASITSEVDLAEETKVDQSLEVESPALWSVETPVLYTAVTRILENGKEVDQYHTPFGFRYFEFTSDQGFFLNGERVQLNGVCLHHDLGPLGAAVNLSSIRHRMKLLQEMGCNAIRTSHNPPAKEMLDLADQMGFLIINEAFDEWKHGKMENGYNILWDEWAEKDLVAFIHRDRNHPSVIAWSIGNEIREQNVPGGEQYAQFLVDICKREDPTRPTTAGFNNWQGAIRNGLADIVDLPAWNYKPMHYKYVHERFPHWKMYGAETASTVSSRGEYFFPVKERVHYTREPYHSSSFDMEFPAGLPPPTVNLPHKTHSLSWPESLYGPALTTLASQPLQC
jgi:beta-galactosidase